MRKDEIAEVLAMLAVSYPKFILGKDTVSVYSRLLSDIPIDQLKAAALQCATTKDFFPSVHELRQAAAELRRQSSGIPNAYEAWEEVKRAGNGERLQLVEVEEGLYIDHSQYQWSHPLIKRVAEMLGWPSEFPGDNPGVDRAHFFKAYDQMVYEAMQESIQLPEVKNYINDQKSNLLEAGNGSNGKVKTLAEVAFSLRERS